MTPVYIPGKCNIGPGAIGRRKKATWISAELTLLTVVLIPMFQACRLWRVILFIPAAALAVTLQQQYSQFCVSFGLNGKFDPCVPGKTGTVENAEIDKRKSIRMITIGVITGWLVSLLFYFLRY